MENFEKFLETYSSNELETKRERTYFENIVFPMEEKYGKKVPYFTREQLIELLSSRRVVSEQTLKKDISTLKAYVKFLYASKEIDKVVFSTFDFLSINKSEIKEDYKYFTSLDEVRRGVLRAYEVSDLPTEIQDYVCCACLTVCYLLWIGFKIDELPLIKKSDYVPGSYVIANKIIPDKEVERTFARYINMEYQVNDLKAFISNSHNLAKFYFCENGYFLRPCALNAENLKIGNSPISVSTLRQKFALLQSLSKNIPDADLREKFEHISVTRLQTASIYCAINQYRQDTSNMDRTIRQEKNDCVDYIMTKYRMDYTKAKRIVREYYIRNGL